MPDLTPIQQLAVVALPLLFAITLHEVAHGWVALRFGDSTAKALGRLTLNPLKHIDPVGTVLVPLLTFGLPMLFGGGPGLLFGWAKPVPVAVGRLRSPRHDMAWVALAGPGANLAMALVWALAMAAGVGLAHAVPLIGEPLIYMGRAGVIVNALFAVLNLLPLPPLDGSRVLAALLPPRQALWLDQMERYGLIVVLLLFMTGILGRVLWPLVGALSSLYFLLVSTLVG